MPKATSLARIVWRGCTFRKARMRVSEGTNTRFGRYEPAELVRKFVEVIRNFVEIVIIFAEVIRKIVAMVTGGTELVGWGVWVSVGYGKRMARTLSNSVGVAIS